MALSCRGNISDIGGNLEILKINVPYCPCDASMTSKVFRLGKISRNGKVSMKNFIKQL